MALSTKNIQSLKIFDTNSWEMVFGDLPSYPDKSNDYLRGKETLLSKRVLSVSTPFVELTTENKNTGEKYITGYTPIQNVTVTFLEDEQLSVQSILVLLKESIFNSSKGYFINGRAGEISGSKINFIKPDGTVYRSLQINGMRVSSISEVTFSYNDEPMIISASFSIKSIEGYSEYISNSTRN